MVDIVSGVTQPRGAPRQFFPLGPPKIRAPLGPPTAPPSLLKNSGEQGRGPGPLGPSSGPPPFLIEAPGGIFLYL